MRSLLAHGLGALALCSAQSALACTVVVPHGYEGSGRQFRGVKRALGNATAIVDGEVIRPASRQRNETALVRVHHRLKGQVPDVIEVGPGGGGDCSVALDRLGERSRMILSGSPPIYMLYRDQSEARIEDRFLRSDRRKVWPYFAGIGQPVE